MEVQVNLDMTDLMGLGKLVRHMQNPSYTYDEYLICIGLGPSILSVICENLSYSGPSYPSSPVFPTDLLVYLSAIYPQGSREDIQIWPGRQAMFEHLLPPAVLFSIHKQIGYHGSFRL